MPDDGAGRPLVRAVCFDLDGTLVETEYLKALSYAHTAADLRPDTPVAEVVAAYGALAGESRDMVAATLAARFALPGTPERFLELRLARYDAMLADDATVRGQAYAPTIAVLRAVRARGYRTGVATMSYAGQVRRVLDVLSLGDAFDAVVPREAVREPKPSPEIYLLLAERLGVPPHECLAIEDSVPGIRSALAAGMPCVAVTTELTRASVHASRLLPPHRVVDDRAGLAGVVDGILDAGAV
jgi:HAD superfamily hydrolase (TIGR01509 family)